ncbi:non-homologous end-joining DNA ligase [Actinosynnema sp. NPDC020468]|uniref:non-homologous end-joining DNA ligase n=1 Tax=Actinosynnema sp. NPDC020468 TaxID=3154488 RepID=UPI0033E32762
MLATPGPLPSGAGWAYEFKWDGVRLVVYVRGGAVRALTRNDIDVTGAYPELGVLAGALGGRDAVLDGEVVAVDAGGRPDFARLQSRMHVREPGEALRAAVPVAYYVFDLLHLGTPLLALPYAERRARLAGCGLTGHREVLVPPHFTGVDGRDVLGAAVEHGLEGVVAKRVDSRYEPGRRSAAWVKVPLLHTREVLIGGWRPGEGRRAGTIGSLLLGVPTPDGLHYAGKVGTGFTHAALITLHDLLRPLEQPRSPFASAVPPREAAHAHWTAPLLVAEVEFRTRTPEGRLRHASWRGLRPDRTPDDIG